MGAFDRQEGSLPLIGGRRESFERSQWDAQKPKETSPRPLRNLARPKEQVFPQEREQFQQRDTGIGFIGVGPFRRVQRNAAEDLVSHSLPCVRMERHHQARKLITAHAESSRIKAAASSTVMA